MVIYTWDKADVSVLTVSDQLVTAAPHTIPKDSAREREREKGRKEKREGGRERKEERKKERKKENPPCSLRFDSE